MYRWTSRIHGRSLSEAPSPHRRSGHTDPLRISPGRSLSQKHPLSSHFFRLPLFRFHPLRLHFLHLHFCHLHVFYPPYDSPPDPVLIFYAPSLLYIINLIQQPALPSVRISLTAESAVPSQTSREHPAHPPDRSSSPACS